VAIKRLVDVSWDNIEIEFVFGKSGATTLWQYTQYGSTATEDTESNQVPLDVFYLPVRQMKSDFCNENYEQPTVSGLLLLPTGERGQFRRVGQFEIWEDDEGDLAAFTDTTTVIDRRFYMAKDENGDVTVAIT